MPEFEGVGKSVVGFISESKLTESKSEAKRLLEQKAVKVNSTVVTEWEHKLASGDVVQIGPRKFAKVK